MLSSLVMENIENSLNTFKVNQAKNEIFELLNPAS